MVIGSTVTQLLVPDFWVQRVVWIGGRFNSWIDRWIVRVQWVKHIP